MAPYVLLTMLLMKPLMGYCFLWTQLDNVTSQGMVIPGSKFQQGRRKVEMFGGSMPIYPQRLKRQTSQHCIDSGKLWGGHGPLAPGSSGPASYDRKNTINGRAGGTKGTMASPKIQDSDGLTNTQISQGLLVEVTQIFLTSAHPERDIEYMSASN